MFFKKNETPRMALARRIRERMREKHITEPMLAKRVGVNRTTVYNWASGRRVPDAVHIPQLCRALQLRSSQLVV